MCLVSICKRPRAPIEAGPKAARRKTDPKCAHFWGGNMKSVSPAKPSRSKVCPEASSSVFRSASKISS